MEYLFSFDGRVDRQAFWTSAAINFAVGMIMATLLAFLIYDGSTGDPNGVLVAGTLVMALVSLFVSFSGLSFGVRRWHDLDKSGWWCLIALVPLVGSLYALGMQGFVSGSEQRNKYGPPVRRGGAETSPNRTTSTTSLYSPKMSAARAAEIERKTVV